MKMRAVSTEYWHVLRAYFLFVSFDACLAVPRGTLLACYGMYCTQRKNIPILVVLPRRVWGSGF